MAQSISTGGAHAVDVGVLDIAYGRTEQRHPLDALVPDPKGLSPLGDESWFAEILSAMVTVAAPRLFAVVQEYGERVDGRIAAWGMAFEDHVDIVSVEGGIRMALPGPENVLPYFDRGSHVKARLVWLAD